MNSAVEQLNYHYYFYNCLCDIYPDKFYDWKIIMLYNCAYYGLKALGLTEGVEIGGTHEEVEIKANPKYSPRANFGVKLRIKKSAWDNYNSLYHYSTVASRQTMLSMINLETYEELKKEEYERCLKHFENFIKYIHIERNIVIAVGNVSVSENSPSLSRSKTPISIHGMRGTPNSEGSPNDTRDYLRGEEPGSEREKGSSGRHSRPGVSHNHRKQGDPSDKKGEETSFFQKLFKGIGKLE